ncbi:guanylate-binding family protein [Striga asiatica]|uniref:Guanylate-binding family protein n=1 Tax=Striga asiatica TaxID=4170 RepID=A0A5A7PB44_STRAF|nr:guanylate-binding family protein [Striga asiatica]
MRIFSPPLVFVTLLSFFAPGSFSIENFRQAFPIIEPAPGHTKLRLSREGLEAIEKITTPIAAVAVIGPYRSGKSFLLNQLLSLSCYEGFGVGHLRDTKTKGIWVWGTPIELDIDGVKTSVFYLDTEGFESVGKSNVYDDRIFALATVMSSVLIYNLPETIREADISRLSFAVELAEEFYGRVKGQDVAFEPAKLLWLIQRDFLQGKSVQEMVDESLRRVPNANGDKNIDQVNQIRESLAIMGDNSTAFSLPQPHLQRTKLCDMNDTELDPLYVKRRDQLKSVVSSIIRPKIVQGSLVEVFNKGILDRCLKLYSDRMGKLGFPISENTLQQAHEGSKVAAMSAFDEQHFGRHHAKLSAEKLVEEIESVYKNFVLANEYQSSKLCEGLYTSCEEKMDQLQVLRLPSMAKFNAGFLQCNQSFEKQCVGPSKSNYEMRMMKMLGRSKSLFIKEYNHRLFNWLVGFSLVMVIVGRFILKFFLVEIGAWILFIFLETYTRMFWSSESLYYNSVWHAIVGTWEAVVYSPVLDLDRWAIPLGVVAGILVLYWRCYGRRKPYLAGYLFLEFISSMANKPQIRTTSSALIAMIADEDTITGFLLAGVGNVDLRRKTNYLIVDSKTTVKQIEDAFKEFTTREDIAVVLISQFVANMIRFVVDSYNKPIPAILEIPSKDHPYDPAHDSVLSRVKYLFSTESVASGRR